jgi:hypothetical protein
MSVDLPALVTQPIHAAPIEKLRAAGVVPINAAWQPMCVLAVESLLDT